MCDAATHLFLVEFTDAWSTVITYRPIYNACSARAYQTNKVTSLLGTLLLGFSCVLQPMHVTVFTANFIRPPTVGVAICIVLV